MVSEDRVPLFRRAGLGYKQFKWFLIWALRKADPDGNDYGNDFTARNLRSARDPMASLVKQFPLTFYDIFMPKANKVVPFLVRMREREEQEAALTAAATRRLRFVDILPKDAEQWEIDRARHRDALDAAFPMLQPLPGETEDQWIMREFAPVRNPDWRCSKCEYGVSLDGKDDVRNKWCADCDEERRWQQDEDKEAECFEAPSVSCLTKEWDGSEFEPEIINTEESCDET